MNHLIIFVSCFFFTAIYVLLSITKTINPNTMSSQTGQPQETLIILPDLMKVRINTTNVISHVIYMAKIVFFFIFIFLFP